MDSPFEDAGSFYREIKIKNIGDGAARLNNFILTSEYSLRLNRCPSELLPNKECSIQVLLKNAKYGAPAPDKILVVSAQSPNNDEIKEQVELVSGSVSNYVPVYIPTYPAPPANTVNTACAGTISHVQSASTCTEEAFGTSVSTSLCNTRTTTYLSPAGPAPSQPIANGQRDYSCDLGSEFAVFSSGSCNASYVYLPTTEAGICRVQLTITEGTCNSSAFEGENCQPSISGGNGPFTYTSSNLTNGATINASTGQLNPDAKTGPTTVTVTDSLGQVASVTLSNIKPLYRSCKEMIQARPSELNQHKIYNIDEDGIRTGVARTVLFCEHVADGGGWTRLYSGHSNSASNTISSQFESNIIFNAATEIMVYYADANNEQLTTKYKFSKPANFNLWNVRGGSHSTTVHNLNNGTSVLGVVKYGHENWNTICGAPYGATNNYYGRFALCDQGTSPIANPNFGQFPQYSHQSTAGTDNCSTMESSNYSNPSCSSNRALVIYAR